jgi:hypothetical protein
MNRKWFAEAHVLTTKLTPAECQARLKARLAPWPNWRPNPEHPVAGSVSPTGFELTKVISSRNSFQTVARGTFSNLDGGTQIRVTLGPSPLVAVFGVFFVLVAVGILVVALSSGSTNASVGSVPLVVIPLGMLIVGVLAATLGRFAARGESVFLLKFLRTELEAFEVPATPATIST